MQQIANKVKYVLRFSDGGYYAGRNEKYGDMFNKSYGGACHAKKISL